MKESTYILGTKGLIMITRLILFLPFMVACQTAKKIDWPKIANDSDQYYLGEALNSDRNWSCSDPKAEVLARSGYQDLHPYQRVSSILVTGCGQNATYAVICQRKGVYYCPIAANTCRGAAPCLVLSPDEEKLYRKRVQIEAKQRSRRSRR